LIIIVLLFFVVVQPVSAASFNCRSNYLKPVAKLICMNPELSRLDDEMVSVYKKVRARGTYPGLRNEQKSWFRYRNNCGYDVVCLKQAYIGRINTLRLMLVSEKFEHPHHKGH